MSRGSDAEFEFKTCLNYAPRNSAALLGLARSCWQQQKISQALVVVENLIQKSDAPLGRALIENRAKGEVRYYDAKKRMGRPCSRPDSDSKYQYSTGREAYDAHGGWIASAVDFAKFAAAFDYPAKCLILGASAIEEMWARPDGAAGKETDGKPKAAFYGCGWTVRPVDTTGKSNTWHAGYIAGTEALLVRRFDGLNWAVLFSTHHSPDGKSPRDSLTDAYTKLRAT